MPTDAVSDAVAGPHWLIKALIIALISALVSFVIRGNAPIFESMRALTNEVAKGALDQYISPPRTAPSDQQSALARPLPSPIPETRSSPTPDYSALAAEVRNKLHACDARSKQNPDKPQFLVLPVISREINVFETTLGRSRFLLSSSLLDRLERGELRLYNGYYQVHLDRNGHTSSYDRGRGLRVFNLNESYGPPVATIAFEAGPSRIVYPGFDKHCPWLILEMLAR